MAPKCDRFGDPDYFRLRHVGPEMYRGYRLPRYISGELPSDRKSRILDIGCGLGQMLAALVKLGYEEAEGIDVSDAAVSACRDAGLAARRIDDIVDFCREQAEPSFDLVIMSHVLEHIEKASIVGTLREIRTRLLRPGCPLLVMVPNAQSATGCYWAYEDFTHTTLFTAGSLRYVLGAAGFREIRFLDADGLGASRAWVRPLKRGLLAVYHVKIAFWNLVTGSAFHAPSPRIFTYELKALAR